MKRNKEVYICVTLYHLYLSLLFISKHNSKESSVLLLNSNDKQIYSQFFNLENTLKSNGYKVSCRLRDKTRDILGLEEIENRKQIKMLENMFGEKIEGNFTLYNFAWNLQYIYSTANLCFKKCKESYFIEEGALTAINPSQSSIKVAVKRMTGTVVDFYKEPKLKGILVQKPEIYPEAWKDKLITLQMDELITPMKEKTKDVIIKVFMGDLLDRLEDGELKDMGIVYTQPLSEDGFISEKQKIDYFTQMVQYYSKYGKPILKLHPRDLTEYNIASEITVLPSYFPSELLNLLNIRFRYAVGICTSAVPTTDADIRLNINEDFLKDLKFELKPLDKVMPATGCC